MAYSPDLGVVSSLSRRAPLTIWPMPSLKDFDYYVAAVCSACGDTLLARFRDQKDDAKGPTRLRANLEDVFQRHLAEKHKMKDELDRTA